MILKPCPLIRSNNSIPLVGIKLGGTTWIGEAKFVVVGLFNGVKKPPSEGVITGVIGISSRSNNKSKFDFGLLSFGLVSGTGFFKLSFPWSLCSPLLSSSLSDEELSDSSDEDSVSSFLHQKKRIIRN